jgi:TonB family protein
MMSSRKHQTAVTDSKDDNYEAAVLEFLDKELAASQPYRNPSDQSVELDALVSDLLKQVITESDQLRESETSTAEDEAASMIASLTIEPTEVSDPGSGLVANLDRGLSQTVSEEDLWDSGSSDPQLSQQVADLYNVILDSVSPDSVSTPIAEPPVPFPATPADEAENRPIHAPAEVKPESPRPSLSGDVVFRTIVTPTRRLPMKAIALIGALIVVSAVIYFFLNSRGGTSEIAGVPASVPTTVVTDAENQVPTPPVRPPSSAEKPKKASPPASRTVSATTPPKVASASIAQRPAPAGKNAPSANTQQSASNSKENIASTPLPAAAKKVEAKAATEQKAAQEKPAATLPKAPAPVVATPASLDVADTAPPLATSGNTILVTDVAQKAPVQLVASDTEKLEPLQPRSQPLLTMPAQSRVLVPPVAIAQPSPSYPELALRSRTSASVILDLQVDERGKVTRATPMSGPVLFHSAAVAATLKWRYKPASIDGKNVASAVRVTLNFTLKK